MSVATPFIHHYPFLLEGDILSLSSSFRIQDKVLYDLPLKAMHHLRDPGKKLVAALAASCTYGSLIQTARTQGVTGRQLTELLGFLNMIGALQCRRNTEQRFKALYTLGFHAVIGTFYTSLSWRRPATPIAVLLGIMRATYPVAVATVGTIGIAVGGGLVSARVGLSAGLFGLLLFNASLLVHEMVHIVVAQRYAAQPQLIQRGLRIGVVHRRLEPRLEALSSVTGPIGGTTVCFIAALLLLLFGMHLLALLGAIIATFHIFSLLPWYGDGASLSKALREK